jgi:signal transduction histidine kinase
MKHQEQHCLDKGRLLMPSIINWFTVFQYLGVVGIYICYTMTGFYRFPSPWLGGTILISGVLILVALDRQEYRYQAQEKEPDRLAVAIIQFSRAVLIVVFSFSDGLGLIHSAVLLPVIFFTFFFLCGRSYRLTGLVWMLYLIIRVHMFVNSYFYIPWPDQRDDMTRDYFFILILAFILTMAYQAKRERANRLRVEKLLSELEISHRQLQDYAEKVAESATIEERNRLARDIHDSLGHYLTVINVQLEKAMAFRDRNPQEADRAVRDSKRLASEALQDIRHSVGALRNTQETFPLIQSVTGLVNNMRSGKLSIELEIEGNEEGFSQQSLITLYRAAQEGLTNIQKHAQAGCAMVSIKLNDQLASLCIVDDGQGVDTDIIGKDETHFGLKGVRERLELIQGSIELESAPGKGMKLFITVPKNHLH